VPGAAEDRPGRGTRDEEQPRNEERAADDRGAGRADQRRERPTDRHSDPASGVLSEERHQPQEAHPPAEPERADVEELAACEKQDAERDERHREHVGGVADDVRQYAGEP
jgi:hypothetical protein